MVSLRKVFVKIKILFRIRIRFMILLWISIPDLHFTTWKTSTKFCLDPLTPSKVIVSTWKVHVRTYIQTSRHPDRQTDIFFGLFCLLRHKNHKNLSKGENFFFHSCDYNTFAFYILRMWWKSKKMQILWGLALYFLITCIGTE